MTIYGVGSAIARSLYGRNRKVNRAAPRIPIQPKTAAMGFDNRFTKRQADAETLGLGG